jgi:hydrogenase maturation protease
MICTGSPVLLVDVIRSGRTPGTVVSLALEELKERVVDGSQVSSHGLGPAQAVRLADALGREISPGYFVGIEGVSFAPGNQLSDAVKDAVPTLVEELKRRHRQLLDESAHHTQNEETPCTNTD